MYKFVFFGSGDPVVTVLGMNHEPCMKARSFTTCFICLVLSLHLSALVCPKTARTRLRIRPTTAARSLRAGPSGTGKLLCRSRPKEASQCYGRHGHAVRCHGVLTNGAPSARVFTGAEEEKAAVFRVFFLRMARFLLEETKRTKDRGGNIRWLAPQVYGFGWREEGEAWVTGDPIS